MADLENGIRVSEKLRRDSYDRLVRYVMAAFLLLSASGWVLSTCALVSTYRGPRMLLLLGASCWMLMAFLAFLTVRGTLWPVTALCAVALVARFFSLLSPKLQEFGGGTSAQLLDGLILLTFLLWAAVRRTVTYSRHRGLRVLFVVAVAGSALIQLPGGYESARARLEQIFCKPDPIEHDVGRKLGVLEFETVSGETITLGDPGRVYMVDFWSPNCGPCIEEMPELARLQRELAGSPHASVILATTGKAGARLSEPVMSKLGETHFVTSSDRQLVRLGVSSFPTKLFLRDGILLDVVVGAQEDTYRFCKDKLESLAAEKRRNP